MRKLQKARLANMDIEEVSVVDKAANQRKFLFKKRDDSKTEGGENLELLKRLQKNEKVIKAVEGIDAHLSALDAEIDKLLAKKDLGDDERKLLKAKKNEFGLMKQDIEEQFEHLFMDKVDAEDSEEESDEDAEDVEKEDDESAEEEVEKEDDEEMTEEEDKEDKKQIPPKKKPKMRKSEESSEDEDDSDEEESEDSKDKTNVRKRGETSDEDASDDDDEDSSDDEEDLDEESEKLLQELNKETKELMKSNQELKEQLSK